MPGLTIILIAVVAALFFLHLATIAVTVVSARSTRRPLPAPAAAPAITMLRPASGIDHETRATLASSFGLDYPNYEIVFCVANRDDPVIALIENLIDEHPDAPARILVGDDPISSNPKLNNLVKGWAAARHDWIVMTDGNVLLPADYLQYLMSFWGEQTGLVSAPAIGGAPASFGAELECVFLNQHEARWQIAADGPGLGYAQGKTMLWRRDLLDGTGGMAALVSEPGEDAAATKIVRQAGLNVRLVPGPFTQPLGRRSFAQMWQRQVRWAQLRRASFPFLYAMEILTGSTIPLIAGTALVGLGTIPAGVLAIMAVVWFGAELALAPLAGWHWSKLTLPSLVCRDLLLPVLWISGMAGRRFQWHGHVIDTSASGRPPHS